MGTSQTKKPTPQHLSFDDLVLTDLHNFPLDTGRLLRMSIDFKAGAPWAWCPIAVVKQATGYVILDGRLRALVRQQAGFTTVPCLVYKDNERAERTCQETGKGPRRGDPNAERYKARFGRKAWEVDALIATDPDALRERVATAITEIRGDELWDASIEKETVDQAWLTKRVDRIKADARRRS